MNVRMSLALLSSAALSATVLCGAQLDAYRNFRLGMTVADAAKQTGLAATDVRLASTRPERIEELDWHVNWTPRSAAQSLPFSELLLRFYNGKLFEMAVSYNRDQTRGLTENDMIDAISAVYGPASLPPAAEVTFPSGLTGSVLPVIARWGDSVSQLNLVHLLYGPGFGLVISTQADKILAEQAMAESDRLKEAEAPQREIDLRARQVAETLAADEKARALNKAGFRP